MMRFASIALGLCMVFASLATTLAAAQSDEAMSAQLDALFGEHEPYEAFFIVLKDAVSAGDREAVAAMVAYPFGTMIGGEPVTIPSEDDFLRHYDQLFTPAVVMAVDEQTYATLFANSEGVMIGDGELWFSGICSDDACSEVDVKITAINVPEGE